MENRPDLSDAEREVLRVVWDEGAATVRAVREALQARGRSWAYTTVATLLQRLLAKGYVGQVGERSPLVYEAKVSREDLLETRLRDAAEELCDGRAAPLVLALVQGNRFTSEELARFRKLLDEAQDEDRVKDAKKGLRDKA